MKHGWEYKKLGEVGTIITGSTPPTSNPKNYESKDICFVKPSDIEKEGITHISKAENYISNYAYNNSCRRLPKGSVLITCIGIIGKVGILEVDATCNQQINALVPKEELSSKYIAYALLSIKELMQSVANAPVVPIINKGQFSSFCIPLPALAVQERIVGELDKVREIIEKKKEQVKGLDSLAQSMFYEMFGDPVENEKGWEKCKWSDCLTIYNGKNQKQVECADGKYPICGSGGIMGYANNYITPSDSVIIGRKGNINKPIYMSQSFWNVDTAFGLHPKENLIAKYLYFYCIIFDFEQLNKAVTIPSLTKSDLLNIEISLPPLSLQQSFAQKIEAIEKQKELITASIKEAQLLFDSRMEYWFGE